MTMALSIDDIEYQAATLALQGNALIVRGCVLALRGNALTLQGDAFINHVPPLTNRGLAIKCHAVIQALLMDASKKPPTAIQSRELTDWLSRGCGLEQSSSLPRSSIAISSKAIAFGQNHTIKIHHSLWLGWARPYNGLQLYKKASMAGGESKVSIYAALGANIAIGVAKFVGAAISGSSAMLSEGIHSVVDSVNELLLLYGLKQSEAPPSDQFPLGHGQELYFWLLMVAVLIFSLGVACRCMRGGIAFNTLRSATMP
ncbi:MULTISPECIES: cation diffusion facilitator family transporter [Cyanophyceae]|uniref:Cation transporter n=1 Tax=Leptolyngbya subtilissima DQ-A4 TaxID=2933933 RepID=A0ABV0K2N1_9CYAN|nr:cation transporter [Nodosilinea sp. FACHB-141]